MLLQSIILVVTACYNHVTARHSYVIAFCNDVITRDNDAIVW